MSFWDALAGAAEGFGAAWDFKKKSELAERMEKEREERADQRLKDKEKRQEAKELRTPDPARDQADPERGVIKLFNKNGDPLGEIPMSEHQREGIQIGRESERVSLDNLVTTGDINRTRLEHMPLEFGMKQEAHRSRLETDAARRREAAARAEAARSRDSASSIEEGPTNTEVANQLLEDYADIIEQYQGDFADFTPEVARRNAERAARAARAQGRDAGAMFYDGLTRWAQSFRGN